MVYIDIKKKDSDLLNENEEKLNSLIKKIIIINRKWTSKVLSRKTNLGDLILIQNIKTKSIKKLEKYLNIYSIKKVCLSNNLNNESSILSIFKKENIEVFEGQELKKYLILELIKFICINKGIELQNIEVSFLALKNTKLINSYIEKISPRIKVINIITQESNQFKKTENSLFQDFGIIINTTYNYKKSLIGSKIIINFDFSSEEINKFIIPDDAVIFSLTKEKIIIKKKSFKGLNIQDFKYKLFRKMSFDKFLTDFNKESVYESVVMKNSNIDNILKKVEEDNIKVVEIYGQNGLIRKKELGKNNMQTM